ncbi:hypothetical protein MT49_2655 [Mycobacterium tuberculosis 49-02]|nr:hypothetical protein BTB1458_2694 [Mycobacterium tuberculosis]CDM10797.1 hypothetical protein MT49_2655 [Mycobacterium tuberculosis 49-02]SIP65544.1 conserved hypothetical protein [Mycobacterium tuberculosis]
MLCDQAYLTVAPDQLADNPGKTLVGLLAAAERAKHQTDSSRRAGATNRASSSRLRVVSTAAAVCGISVTPSPPVTHCTTVASHTARVLGSIERLVA